MHAVLLLVLWEPEQNRREGHCFPIENQKGPIRSGNVSVWKIA